MGDGGWRGCLKSNMIKTNRHSQKLGKTYLNCLTSRMSAMGNGNGISQPYELRPGSIKTKRKNASREKGRTRKREALDTPRVKLGYTDLQVSWKSNSTSFISMPNYIIPWYLWVISSWKASILIKSDTFSSSRKHHSYITIKITTSLFKSFWWFSKFISELDFS